MRRRNKVFLLVLVIIIIAIGLKYGPRVYNKLASLIRIHQTGIIYKAVFNRSSGLSSMDLVFSGNKRAEIVKIKNRYAVKLSLDRTKNKNHYRSELIPSNLNSNYFYGNRAMIGDEYWYHIDVFLPKNWEFGNVSKTIMQWHGSPDFNLGEHWRNPPFDLEIDSGSSGIGRNYFLRHRADSNKVTGSQGPYQINERFEIGSIVGDLGRWVSWSFHIKWSYKNDGFIIVYKDGKEIFRKLHEKNTYNDQVGPFWKFGVYIPSWKDPNFPKYGSDHYTAYFDSIMIGTHKMKIWRSYKIN